MDNFRATTKTGTTYTYNGHTIRIESARTGTSVFLPWRTAEFSTEEMKETTLGMWEFLKSMPPIEDVPTVGKHMYFGGKDEWRVSTLVVSVEKL